MNSLFITSQFFEKAFQQIILGIVQGVTEFLPISSTAHLMIVPTFLGWGDPGVTTIAAIQLGSIIAVLIYFKSELLDLSKGLSYLFIQEKITHPKARLASAILIGNIPIVLVGLIIKIFWPSYASSLFRSVPSVAFVSILMAIVLAFSEQIATRRRPLASIKGKDGLFVGLSQVLALIPGVSRSGITISTSLMSGLSRDSSARFSFLLGIPAITLAGLVEFNEAMQGLILGDFSALLLGIISAAITSWLAIDLLIKFLKNNSTMVFVFYRLFFGVFLLYWYYFIQ